MAKIACLLLFLLRYLMLHTTSGSRFPFASASIMGSCGKVYVVAGTGNTYSTDHGVIFARIRAYMHTYTESATMLKHRVPLIART